MTKKEYKTGLTFIRKNSGTEEEERKRIREWQRLARPLINNEKNNYPQYA